MESQVTEPSTRPSDRYLTTRAGLGKLLYLQLFENARATRLGDWLSFAHARQAYTKLIGSWDNLKAEWVMLSFIAMVYGGLHLATWRGPFLTQFEEWTWKVGSLLTAITTVSVMVSVILGAFLEKRWKGERFTEMYKLLCAILLGLGIGPVIFTRLFLFVECFITLREVRADTYAVVDWAETWPHMG